MSKVSIMKTNYSEPMIERLIEPLDGMKHFIEKEDRVLTP